MSPSLFGGSDDDANDDDTDTGADPTPAPEPEPEPEPDDSGNDNPRVSRSTLRIAGALTVVVAVLGGLAATAWVGWGPIAAALFVGGLVGGATAPPAIILSGRELIPNIVAVGLAIAAQIAFGAAALVRREDGRHEWTVLRDAPDGFVAELENGRRVHINASDGELFSFGLGDLAVVEEKGRNLDQFTVVSTPGSSDQPVEQRAGVDVKPPRADGNGHLVSLTQIQRVVRGSASSTLVRRGRDKALDEQGGTGQLSELWTMALATVLLVLGFGMTAGVLMV